MKNITLIMAVRITKNQTCFGNIAGRKDSHGQNHTQPFGSGAISRASKLTLRELEFTINNIATYQSDIILLLKL